MTHKRVILFIPLIGVSVLLIFIFWCYLKSPLQFYSGGDARIHCVGRFDKTDPTAPKAWAPGAYIAFDFEGSSCEIELEDELRFLIDHNYIEYSVDGGEPIRLKLANKFNRLKVAVNMPYGIHRVILYKNTESANGYLKLIGVRCAKLLPLKKTKKKYIEFIGDSITCGNGADNSQIPFKKGTWYDYHNAYLSYGALLARELDAEYILSAVSGIGLAESCCGIDYTMSDVYDCIDFHENHKKWNFENQPKPALIFITLGQNDALKNESVYEKKYLEFLAMLRGHYKNSVIICCTSPMASSKFKLQLKKSIAKVVDYRQKNGDNKIFFFNYAGTYNAGYKKHPTIQQHQLMMRELLAFLRDLTLC